MFLSEWDANILSKKYSDIFSDEDSHLFYLNNNRTKDFDINITTNEIITVMKSIKSNAIGTDGIPGSIYRKYSYFFVLPLKIKNFSLFV